MSTATHNLHTETRESHLVRATIAQPATAPRREYRERDFGIGYGNSSGYASNRRYASQWAAPRFRCT